MRRKLNCVPAVLCLFLLVCGTASATPYSWNGGDGRWADSGKWTPNGVPGALDSASFLVNSTQTVTVDADATPFSMSLDTGTSGAAQTFSISPGANLTLDNFTLTSSQPTAVTITGGGRIALTNEPLWVSGNLNPRTFTVSGRGTFFDMPKPKQSGLYIGSKDADHLDVNNLFHVTAGATAIVANATCVGHTINIGTGSRGTLLVDDGAYFDGGLFVYIGRSYMKPGCVCAVTNATLVGGQMGPGAGWHHAFVGSNAVVRATSGIGFPLEEFVNSSAVRYSRMEFEDSLLEAPIIALLQGNSYSTGTLSRCVLKCEKLKGCLGRYTCGSLFDLVDSCVTCQEIRVSSIGASNNVIRAIRTNLDCKRIAVGWEDSCTNTFRVEGGTVLCGALNAGYRETAAESRYEQVGGSFTATNAVVIGAYDSRSCGAAFRGVSFAAGEIVCGDVLVTNLNYETFRSRDAYLEFADMANLETHKLCVGLGSIGARLYMTNTTATVTYSGTTDATIPTMVGRNAGATGNLLLLEDSTVSQTGGNVFVGRFRGATNNTLRLVRSTYNFATANNKGDVIVGYDEGANGNRMELLDHSTFTYDRAWFAVGHNAASNVLLVSNGSSLNLTSASSQLHIGNGGTISDAGNRLVMENGSSVRASVEAVHGLAPKVHVFRNTTRGAVWSFLNDHDGTGQELLVRELDLVHLDPYPVSDKYADWIIPGDMSYMSGLARRYGKPLMPWLQAHAYAPCGLKHVTPEDVTRMFDQHARFAPDALMWLGYDRRPASAATFPIGNPASWEKAAEIHAAFHAEANREKQMARLAVLRPYSVRALVCDVEKGFVRNPADALLGSFVRAWSVRFGRAFDVFEIPPDESPADRARRDAELAKYDWIVSTVPYPRARVIGAGTEGTVMTPAQMHAAYKNFVAEIGEGKTF